MASEVIAYVAISLDGYIADKGGSDKFLGEFNSKEYDFDSFAKSVGALVMGSTTYEDLLRWDWPYGDIPCVVLTSRELEVAKGANITFSWESTAEVIRTQAHKTARRLWVVGGGKVITTGLRQGAIDTLEIYVVPVVLGSGVPLFHGPYNERLTLTGSKEFTNSVIKLVYTATTRSPASGGRT